MHRQHWGHRRTALPLCPKPEFPGLGQASEFLCRGLGSNRDEHSGMILTPIQPRDAPEHAGGSHSASGAEEEEKGTQEFW